MTSRLQRGLIVLGIVLGIRLWWLPDSERVAPALVSRAASARSDSRILLTDTSQVLKEIEQLRSALLRKRAGYLRASDAGSSTVALISTLVRDADSSGLRVRSLTPEGPIDRDGSVHVLVDGDGSVATVARFLASVETHPPIRRIRRIRLTMMDVSADQLVRVTAKVEGLTAAHVSVSRER